MAMTAYLDDFDVEAGTKEVLDLALSGGVPSAARGLPVPR